jgi:hypothetical protein
MKRIASELLKMAKGIVSEVSSRETAKFLSGLLGKKVSGGVGGKHPFYTISGENERVIVEKGGKFYFAVPSDGGEFLKMKPLKVSKNVVSDYESDVIGLGDVIKRKLGRRHPFKYDAKAKSWVLSGSKAVSDFYDAHWDEGLTPREMRNKLKKKLGRNDIIADLDDSYMWISLD